MRVFRTTYGKGELKRWARNWYIECRDHLEIIRRFTGFPNKARSLALGHRIEQLVACKIAGAYPSGELLHWLEQIPTKLKNKLVKYNLIDPQQASAGLPLSNHIKDFKQSLLDKRNTQDYVNLQVGRVKKIFDNCGFATWTDINLNRVQRSIADLRASAKTSNYYLQAVKQFCKWMVWNRRAGKSPVEYLQSIRTGVDKTRQRRALGPDEIRTLLEAAEAAPKRFNMEGYERAMLYRLAIETGLRANELRSLTVSSFDFKDCTVTVEAEFSKRRCRDTLPLRKVTALMMRNLLSGKMFNVVAFNLPSKYNMAKMIRKDLADAGISVDDNGSVVDFHSLRHSTGSLLAASGVHPKVAQSIMRHSDINLTMSRYTHIFRGQESQAIESLPDFSKRPRSNHKHG